jgi:phage terminase small subunit
MAGKPGRSGGARPGAGRPKKVKASDGAAVQVSMEAQPHGGALKRSKAAPVEIAERDMLQLLQDIALGRVDATGLQVRAAIAAVQYTHTKKGDGGKKDEEAEKAKKAGAGRFAAAAPPRLAAAGGKKV